MLEPVGWLVSQSWVTIIWCLNLRKTVSSLVWHYCFWRSTKMKTLQKQNLDEKSFFFSLKVPKATQSNGREGWFDERENLDQQQWAINLAVQAHEVIEPVHVYTLWSLKWQSKCPVPYQLKPGKKKEIEKMSLLWWIYLSVIPNSR